MTQTIEQLTARVRELEEENARLHEQVDLQIPAIAFKQLTEQLAASQAYAEQLREALETLNKVSNIGCGCVEKALSLPHDTSALDAYIAEKVKEAISTQKEYYEGVFQDEANRIAKQKEQLAAAVKPKKVKVLAWLVENSWVQWRAEDSLPPSINPDEFKRLPALDKEIEV